MSTNRKIELVIGFPAKMLGDFVDFLKRIWDLIKIMFQYFVKGLR